ncbi:MAG TPA: hypothetical protein VJ302_19555, partial [Blastocatellia bacterium]|nr:hypothetical protein [Blastocatellia bacterium]
MNQEPEKNNPYFNLRKQEEVAQETPSAETSPGHDKNGDDDDGAAASRKKRIIFVLVSLVIVLGVIGGLYWKFGNMVTVNQQVNGRSKSKDPTVTEQQPVIDAVIAQAKKERSQAGGAQVGGSPAGGETVVPASQPISGDQAPPAPVPESGGTTTPTSPRLIIPEYTVQQPPNRPTTTGGSGGQSGGTRTSSSGGTTSGRGRGQLKYSKASVYVVEPPPPAARVPITIPVRSSVGGIVRPAATLLEPVRVPEFGSLLHVRTLGTVHTIRNGSFARLELTHDMQGKGWSLKKGTIFVAQTQGSALNRAFVGITGFIDPRTNRTVKVNGDLLGSDGALGLQGKRRMFSSRWSRAFNRALNLAPNIAQAALARGNNGTVLIAPVGQELIGNNYSSIDRREFVEVPA